MIWMKIILLFIWKKVKYQYESILYIFSIYKKQFENLVIKVDGTVSYKPRGVCIEGVNSLGNVIDFIDWLPKIGMNIFSILTTLSPF